MVVKKAGEEEEEEVWRKYFDSLLNEARGGRALVEGIEM